MKRTTIYLDEATREVLEGLARRKGKSRAAVIREAIRRMARETEGGLPRCIGVAEGPGDLSERTDELLAEGFGRDEPCR